MVGRDKVVVPERSLIRKVSLNLALPVNTPHHQSLPACNTKYFVKPAQRTHRTALVSLKINYEQGLNLPKWWINAFGKCRNDMVAALAKQFTLRCLDLPLELQQSPIEYIRRSEDNQYAIINCPSAFAIIQACETRLTFATLEMPARSFVRWLTRGFSTTSQSYRTSKQIENRCRRHVSNSGTTLQQTRITVSRISHCMRRRFSSAKCESTSKSRCFLQPASHASTASRILYKLTLP